MPSLMGSTHSALESHSAVALCRYSGFEVFSEGDRWLLTLAIAVSRGWGRFGFPPGVLPISSAPLRFTSGHSTAKHRVRIAVQNFLGGRAMRWAF